MFSSTSPFLPIPSRFSSDSLIWCPNRSRNFDQNSRARADTKHQTTDQTQGRSFPALAEVRRALQQCCIHTHTCLFLQTPPRSPPPCFLGPHGALRVFPPDSSVLCRAGTREWGAEPRAPRAAAIVHAAPVRDGWEDGNTSKIPVKYKEIEYAHQYSRWNLG